MLYQLQDTIMSQSLVLQLNDVKGNKADIGVKESSNVLDYVTLKAYKFPYINVLWAGVVIMVFGSIISMVHRINKLKVQKLS